MNEVEIASTSFTAYREGNTRTENPRRDHKLSRCERPRTDQSEIVNTVAIAGPDSGEQKRISGMGEYFERKEAYRQRLEGGMNRGESIKGAEVMQST